MCPLRGQSLRRALQLSAGVIQASRRLAGAVEGFVSRASIRTISGGLSALFLVVGVNASGRAPDLKISMSFQADHLTVTVQNTSGSPQQIAARATLHLATPSTEASPTRHFWTSVGFRPRLLVKSSQMARLLVPPKGSLAFPVAVSPLEWYEGMSPEGPRTPATVPAGWYELSASLDGGASNRITVVVDRTGQVAAADK